MVDCGREAGCPASPAQIRTCSLRHPAPPLGCAPRRGDGKSPVRPRVSDFQPRPVGRREMGDPRPAGAVPLRPAAEHAEAQVLQARDEAAKVSKAGRDGVVVQPPVNHLPQPLRRRLDIVMHPPARLRWHRGFGASCRTWTPRCNPETWICPVAGESGACAFPGTGVSSSASRTASPLA